MALYGATRVDLAAAASKGKTSCRKHQRASANQDPSCGRPARRTAQPGPVGGPVLFVTRYETQDPRTYDFRPGCAVGSIAFVHLSHELRKPIGGDEHVVDLRVVNPLDRPGLDALQDFTDRRERREGSMCRALFLDRPLNATVHFSLVDKSAGDGSPPALPRTEAISPTAAPRSRGCVTNGPKTKPRSGRRRGS